MTNGQTSELYDIGKIQSGACNLTQTSTKNRIKKFLSKRNSLVI